MIKTQKAKMMDQIHQHGENLNAIFHTNLEPIQLAKKVHSIEVKAHRLSEDYCNGLIESDDWEDVTEKILIRLDKVLNFRTQHIPVFVNGDPRGYALKIDDEYVRAHSLKIHRDMGGYGILAPEFDGN